MRENRGNELEDFKSQINLVEYAASKGYEYEKDASSRNSTVMRDSSGDKIIIATANDGHGVYFSVKNESDNGSIIDFIQKRENLNLGQIRKELRPWIGRPSEEIQQYRKPLASSKDTQQVLHAYAATKSTKEHPYLLSRGISKKTQEDSRFSGIIREDKRGNAIFPHFNGSGIQGYELKNKDFTGFSRGGTKGVWASNQSANADRFVIVESSIDALSHAQVNKTDSKTAYFSVGGQLSTEQVETLTAILKNAENANNEVVLATDNDGAGHEIAQKVAELNPNVTFTREIPENCNDWNDQLQHDQTAQRELQNAAARQREHELENQRQSRSNGPSMGM